MKNTIILIAVWVVTAAAFAQTQVNPYFKRDGTLVDGHIRTAPNNSNLDNYGTKGNSNPYTGQQGRQEPNYQQPSYQYQQPSYQQPRQQHCGYTSSGRYVCQ